MEARVGTAADDLQEISKLRILRKLLPVTSAARGPRGEPFRRESGRHRKPDAAGDLNCEILSSRLLSLSGSQCPSRSLFTPVPRSSKAAAADTVLGPRHGPGSQASQVVWRRRTASFGPVLAGRRPASSLSPPCAPKDTSCCRMCCRCLQFGFPAPGSPASFHGGSLAELS